MFSSIRALSVLVLLPLAPIARAADTTPPAVSGANVSPTGTYAADAAPVITVKSTVTDAGGVSAVKGIVYQDGQYETYIYLSAASGSSAYSGTYNLASFGANITAAPHVYTVVVEATDTAYNKTDKTASGSVTVQNDSKGPALSGASVSPQIVGKGGSQNVTLKATATEAGSSDTGVDYVDATVSEDGQYRDYVGLDAQNGNSYTNSRLYTIPVGDANPHFWTFQIRGTDNVGNRSTITRYAAQAGTSPQPVPTLTAISPAGAMAHASVKISLTGTNFTTSSTVLFDGLVVPATLNSATSLTATVDGSFLPKAGAVDVKVYNPAPGGGTAGAQTFTINPGLSSVKVSPSTVAGGSTATGTVTLEANAFAAQTVTLRSSNAAASVPASVVVPAGQKMVTFAVTTASVAASTKVTVTAKLGTDSKTATMTVTPSTSHTATLAPTADASVRDGAYADVNYGTATTEYAQTDVSDGTGNNRDTYFKFSVSGFTKVTSAHLRFYAARTDTASGSLTTNVCGVPDTSWTEGGLTFSTRPALGTAAGAASVSGTKYLPYDVDVTAYVAGLIKSTAAQVVSLALHNPNGSSAGVKLNSRENSSPPQLIITGN